MPRRGKGGSERGRVALIHALAHIEFVAIDLAFDLLGRFGGDFPRGFTDDWMAVGADEAMRRFRDVVGLRVGGDLNVVPGVLAIRAGGFTGSLGGGMSLARLAHARSDGPIPYFAEMGSVNPVFLLGEALEKEAKSIAERLYAHLRQRRGRCRFFH